jgi:hypothetical protein
LNIQHVLGGREGTVCVAHGESVAGGDGGRQGQRVVLGVLCEARKRVGRRLRSGAVTPGETESIGTGHKSGNDRGEDDIGLGGKAAPTKRNMVVVEKKKSNILVGLLYVDLS